MDGEAHGFAVLAGMGQEGTNGGAKHGFYIHHTPDLGASCGTVDAARQVAGEVLEAVVGGEPLPSKSGPGRVEVTREAFLEYAVDDAVELDFRARVFEAGQEFVNVAGVFAGRPVDIGIVDLVGVVPEEDVEDVFVEAAVENPEGAAEDSGLIL